MRSILRRPLLPLTSLLWGLQFSFLSPSLALVLVSLYGATPGEVGWTLAIYNAAGFVVALVVPAWADRRREYLWPMLAAAALTVLLAISLALATSLPWATVALIVFGAPAGVGVSLIFAQLVHGGAGTAELMNNRAVYSFSWVAGPPIATALIGWFGDRSILIALAGLGLLSVGTTLALIRQTRRRAAGDDQPVVVAPVPVVHRPTRLGLAVIIVAFVLIQATNSATTAVLILFVGEGLGLPLLWAGLALSLAAALEIPALVWLGRLSERFSLTGLMMFGCLAGLGYVVGMAFAREPWQILSLQVLNAIFVAVLSGIGMALFQHIIAGPGLATGTFGNTRRVANILTGPLIGLAGTPFGYPAVFLSCAVLITAGGVTIGLVGRRTARIAPTS